MATMNDLVAAESDLGRVRKLLRAVIYWVGVKGLPPVLREQVENEIRDINEAYDNLLYESPPEAESLKKWVEGVTKKSDWKCPICGAAWGPKCDHRVCPNGHG